MRPLYYSIVLLTASAVVTAQQPPAPPPSPISDHFAARASYYVGKISTDGHVTDPNAAVPGTQISMENDLGLTPDVHQGRVEFMFRMRERLRMRVDMWEVNRSALASPPITIHYGNIVLLPTDLVTSTFDWRQIDMTGTYSLLQQKRFELGLGLGLHLIQASTDARVYARGVHESFDGAGPFGTVALDGTFLITRRFSFNARAQYMSLNVNSNSGKLGDYHADVQFRWLPNIAFGLGYASTQEHVEVRNHNPNGEMRLDIHGPELFVRASF